MNHYSEYLAFWGSKWNWIFLKDQNSIIPKELELLQRYWKYSNHVCFLRKSKVNCSKWIDIFPMNLELFQNYLKVLDNSKLNFSKNVGLFPKILDFFQRIWNYSKNIGIFWDFRNWIVPIELEFFQKILNYSINIGIFEESKIELFQ